MEVGILLEIHIYYDVLIDQVIYSLAILLAIVALFPFSHMHEDRYEF